MTKYLVVQIGEATFSILFLRCFYCDESSRRRRMYNSFQSSLLRCFYCDGRDTFGINRIDSGSILFTEVLFIVTVSFSLINEGTPDWSVSILFTEVLLL